MATDVGAQSIVQSPNKAVAATPASSRRAKRGISHRADNSADTLTREQRRGRRRGQRGRASDGEKDMVIRTDSVVRVANGSVALVLAGGGAKGLYHIGVIKALEENSIPIDYISGTSMGAIVGALYASGYTADEMSEIVTSGRIEEWVSGKIDDSYKYLYMEREDVPSMFSVYADIKRDTLRDRSQLNLALPHAFVNTAQIDMALTEIFAAASAAASDDFDRLMIPFRCIATDANRHTPVEFRSGSLPFAVRASMSYPILFRPVTDSDGAVLVDGGCYNNFPWQPLEREFSPSFIIGSQCIAANEPITQNSSVEKQIMSLVTMPTDYTLPEGKSLLIKREVGASLLDFSGGQATIEQGYEDALRAMPALKERLASRRTPEQTAQMREAFRSRKPELRFSEMDTEGLNTRQREYARTFVRRSKPSDEDTLQHKTISFEEVRSRYFSLMASNEFTTNAFPKVQYDSLQRDFSIKFDLAAKPAVKFLIGGNLSSTVFNQIFLGLNYFRLGRTATTAYTDLFLGPVSSVVRLGGRTVFMARTPMYLDYSLQGSWHSNLRGSYGNITPVRNTINARTIESYAHLGFGVAASRRSTLELSANAGYNFYSYIDSFDEPNDPSTHNWFRFAASRLQFQYSTLDKIAYPTRGGRFTASVIGVLGRDKYETAELFARGLKHTARREWVGAKIKWEHYPSNWRDWWFSVSYNIEAVYTNHPDFGTPYATILSSPRYTPLPHAQMLYMPEYAANRYAALGVMPTFKVLPSFYVRAGVFAMLRDPLRKDDYLHYMGDFSLVYHTPIGPVSLSLIKYGFDSKNNGYLMFNFGYPIFGSRGLFY